MKTAKDYYEISVLDGMLVSDKESVIEALQMVIDDAEDESWDEQKKQSEKFKELALEFAEWLRHDRTVTQKEYTVFEMFVDPFLCPLDVLYDRFQTEKSIRYLLEPKSILPTKNKDNDTTR